MRWLAVLAIGCGRFAFEPVPAGTGATDASSDGTSIDATLGSGPFGMAVKLDTLSSDVDDDDVTLTGDELEIYFESNRDGEPHLFRSERTDRLAPWPAATIVTELLSGGDELSPEITADGLIMLYSTEPPNVGDIHIAARPTRASLWTPGPEQVPLNGPEEDVGAVMRSDAREVVFHSSRPGVGLRDLYRATRATPSDPWSNPTLISEMSTTDHDESAFFVDDLTLLFAARRAGGQGGLDIYIVERPTVDAPFGTPEPLEGVNTGANETDPWLSPDRRTLYFVSDRDGTFDLFRAER